MQHVLFFLSLAVFFGLTGAALVLWNVGIRRRRLACIRAVEVIAVINGCLLTGQLYWNSIAEFGGVTSLVFGVVFGCSVTAVAVFIFLTRPFSFPEGTQLDYDKLCGECPVEVTSASQLERARAVLHSLRMRSCASGGLVGSAFWFNKHELRYLNELQEAVNGFLEQHPIFRGGPEWIETRTADVELVRALASQAEQFALSRGLCYGRAGSLVKTARSVARYAEELLNEKRKPRRYYHELSDMEGDLQSAQRDARRALELYEAEAAGLIKYATSAHDLLKLASYEKDLARCELVVRKAVQQGESPDFDTQPRDRRYAMLCLGVLLGSQDERQVEAIAAFSRLLEEERVNRSDEFMAALPRLARIHERLKQYAEAEALYREEAETWPKKAGKHYEAICDAHLSLVKVYDLQGKTALALAECERAVAIARDCSTYPSPSELVSALTERMRLQMIVGQPEAASKSYDEMVAALTRSGYIADDSLTMPEHHRLFASVLSAVGRSAEAQERQSAAERQEERYRQIEGDRDGLPGATELGEYLRSRNPLESLRFLI